ncbi:Protein of unknown function [Pyronema omphalodes CBS 100304]|uniref:Uncharacterized protein n=1 Tax=Pyronema omphalodes (strain CBS 100304) TaxID=1076935 RepID=U4LFB5_PYROM|nr:Protein of unknown function [Pyronema omphalodes CBS 100304]
MHVHRRSRNTQFEINIIGDLVNAC